MSASRRGEAVGPRHRGGRPCGFREQRLGLRVGVERLALLDADGLHVEAFERREHVGRLFVHELRQHLEERDGVGVDRVDRLAGAVEELHLRRVGRLRQADRP